MSEAIRQAIGSLPDGVAVRIKVVPGASRSRVVGLLGDRLKVAIAAPAEGGKANRAIVRLLAKHLGVRTADVSIVAGQSRAQKTVHVRGLSAADVAARLG